MSLANEKPYILGSAHVGSSHLTLTRPGFSALSAIVIVTAAIVALILQDNSNSLSSLGLSGLIVPDAESLTQTTRQFWSNPTGWPFDQLITYLGVVILYSPSAWLPGPAPALAINCVSLWGASHIFAAAISRELGATKGNALGLIATVIVATNIYILEVLPYANKEIPLILLTNAFVYIAVFRSNVVLAAIPALTAYVFRDGYSIILLIAAFLLFVRGALGRLLSLLVLFFFFCLMFVPSSDFADFDQSIARNVEIGAGVAGDKFASWGLGISYLARVAGNLLNLGLRPQFFDQWGGNYLLALGYWQLGVLIIAGVAGSTVELGQRGKSGEVSLVIVLTLLCVSYGTFVQPRYMMPLVFYLCARAARLGPWLWPVVLLCITAPFVFAALGALPPLAGG